MKHTLKTLLTASPGLCSVETVAESMTSQNLKEAFKEMALKIVSVNNVDMYVTKRKFLKAQVQLRTNRLNRVFSIFPYTFTIKNNEETKYSREISLANV